MGCDIHGNIEKKVGDHWVMITPLHYGVHEAKKRAYRRFAALAGVRGDGPAPLGFPPDATESTRLARESWGVDGHSDSFLPVEEAARRMLEADKSWPMYVADDYREKYPSSYYFDVEDDGEYRFIFWFDN